MTKVIIASGPVIVEDNKVLLNKHGDTNFWKFCGGQVEGFDYNLVEAAKREVKEEMGIDVEILDENPYLFYTKKGDQDIILVHFKAKRIENIFPDKEIKEWSWLDLDELPDDLAPNIIPTLKHFGYLK